MQLDCLAIRRSPEEDWHLDTCPHLAQALQPHFQQHLRAERQSHLAVGTISFRIPELTFVQATSHPKALISDAYITDPYGQDLAGTHPFPRRKSNDGFR